MYQTLAKKSYLRAQLKKPQPHLVLRIKTQQLQAKRRILFVEEGILMQKPIPVRTGISTPKQDKFFEIRETKQQLRRDSRVGGHTPDVANENKYVRSREQTPEQLMQVQEKTSII